MREHRSEKIHELFVETKKSYPLSTGVRSAGYHVIFFIFILNNIYSGVPSSAMLA